MTFKENIDSDQFETWMITASPWDKICYGSGECLAGRGGVKPEVAQKAWKAYDIDSEVTLFQTRIDRPEGAIFEYWAQKLPRQWDLNKHSSVGRIGKL